MRNENNNVHHEALLSAVGIGFGSVGLVANGTMTSAMIINGSEGVIKAVESGYHVDMFGMIIHYAMAAGIPIQVSLPALIAISALALTDGVVRYREGKKRFDSKQ